MRHIGNLPNEDQARLFGDYLLAKGVRNEIEREGSAGWMVWVADEEQLRDAAKLLEQFRQNPSAPEFAQTAADAERVREQEAKANAAYRKRFFSRARVFPGSRTFGAGALTYSLVVVCVLVSLASQLGYDDTRLKPLFISYPEGFSTGFLPEVRAGEVWRLFTPVLIHFGPVHLFFNMMWLFHLGSMIEGLQGRTRLALLILVLAAVSNVAQYAVAGPAFGGMSGVVYGLFGYVWLRGKFDPASGLFLSRQDVIMGIVWFVACFTGLVGPIANAAHASGLILGAAYGFVSAQFAQHR